ncbi:MAG: hypothetical protein LQ337_009018, partial [Flavoplaca oasis]
MAVVEEPTLGLSLAAPSAVSLLWHSLVLRSGSKGGEKSKGQRNNTDSQLPTPKIRIIHPQDPLLHHGITFNRAFTK